MINSSDTTFCPLRTPVRKAHGARRSARRQRVISLDGRVLYDIGFAAGDEVEEMIDAVGIEYLDLLLDLTGDDYLGAKSIDARFLAEG